MSIKKWIWGEPPQEYPEKVSVKTEVCPCPCGSSNCVTDEVKKEWYGHPMFYVILDAMAELHSRKNHDYAGEEPLSNLKECEDIGIPAHKGVFVRITDKYKRIKEFFKCGTLEVKDESVEDTLMDLAVYSVLCLILYREARDMGKEV